MLYLDLAARSIAACPNPNPIPSRSTRPPRAGRDVLYLDLALEGAVRAALEGGLTLRGDEDAGAAGRNSGDLAAPLAPLLAALENACLSLGSNRELVLCLKDFQARSNPVPNPSTLDTRCRQPLVCCTESRPCACALAVCGGRAGRVACRCPCRPRPRLRAPALLRPSAGARAAARRGSGARAVTACPPGVSLPALLASLPALLSSQPALRAPGLQAAAAEPHRRAAAMRGAAAAERLGRALGELCARYVAALQPAADALGAALGLPAAPIAIFSEEARSAGGPGGGGGILGIGRANACRPAPVFKPRRARRRRARPCWTQCQLREQGTCGA